MVFKNSNLQTVEILARLNSLYFYADPDLNDYF